MPEDHANPVIRALGTALTKVGRFATRHKNALLIGVGLGELTAITASVAVHATIGSENAANMAAASDMAVEAARTTMAAVKLAEQSNNYTANIAFQLHNATAGRFATNPPRQEFNFGK